MTVHIIPGIYVNPLENVYLALDGDRHVLSAYGNICEVTDITRKQPVKEAASAPALNAAVRRLCGAWRADEKDKEILSGGRSATSVGC